MQAVGAGPAPPSKALARGPRAESASWTAVKHGREVVCSGTASRIVDVSDRNVLCLAVRGETAILGLADHGLVEMNVRSGVKTRTLYTKRFGHTDWVSELFHVSHVASDLRTFGKTLSQMSEDRKPWSQTLLS